MFAEDVRAGESYTQVGAKTGHGSLVWVECQGHRSEQNLGGQTGLRELGVVEAGLGVAPGSALNSVRGAALVCPSCLCLTPSPD